MFAELDELDEPTPLDLLTTLDSYCESLPWPNEGHGELAADALVHLARVRIHLRPDQRGLFALIAARTAAHLFSLNLHEPGERMLSLSWQEAATLSAPQRAQHALITAFTLQGHDQVDQSTHARARADALLFDSDIGAAQRAWLFCDHAARLAEFGDYANARRHWVLALEALEVQPDAQLTAAAKLGLAESLVELGELDAAQTLCETTLATLDGEQSESMFFRMLDLNGRRVSSEPQRAMATYETLVVMAEERFGSSAPATQVARGTAAQVMMDHGEPLQALPYARSFADVLLAEPFAPGVQARALGMIIRLQFRCGDAEAARAMLGKIIDLLEARPPIQPDDMREASGLLSQLGVDFASRGMFRLGLEAQVRGFVLHRACQSVADEQTLGRASNVGVTLERLGRLEDAHEWYQRTARQARAISHLRWHEVSEVNAVRVQQALARAGRRVSST